MATTRKDLPEDIDALRVALIAECARTVRLLNHMELAFEELESSASEDEIAAEQAIAKTTNVVAFTRKRPARQPFPEHLPRERVVEPGPVACLCCGSPRLLKQGEAATETLEVIPRQWKSLPRRRPG